MVFLLSRNAEIGISDSEKAMKDCSWSREFVDRNQKPIQLQSLKARELRVFYQTLDSPAFDYIDFPGGHTAGATPVPIPNTEVKPRRADDTARVTVWERRSLPGLNSNGPPRFYRGGPFCLDPPGNSLLF